MADPKLDSVLEALAEHKPRRDVDLARLTTLRVGGTADVFLHVGDTDALCQVLRVARQHGLPVTLIGLGSNVVVPDDGVRGIVVRLVKGLSQVSGIGGAGLPDADIAGETEVEAGAGAVNAHVVRDLHRAGLVGAEFLALVPGTIGGAVVMNAGTRWGELSEILTAVEVVDAERGARWLPASELAMSYRHTELPPGSVVSRARLRVTAGDTEDAARRVKEEKAYREATQPYKLATNGSVFANPPGDHAGRLIDVSGLKGRRDGEAMISDKHANWIVNTSGDASAASVLRLMALARSTVSSEHDVVLRPEVRVLGSGRETAEILDAITAGVEPGAAVRSGDRSGHS